MTTLVVEELETTLTQTVNIQRRMNVVAIRPYLYFDNLPNTTITLAIKQGATTVDSSTLTQAEIIANSSITSSNYAHGFFRFDFTSTPLHAGQSYDIVLSASPYTFSESSWIGWVKEHENHTNNFASSIQYDQDNPLSLQIWSRRP